MAQTLRYCNRFRSRTNFRFDIACWQFIIAWLRAEERSSRVVILDAVKQEEINMSGDDDATKNMERALSSRSEEAVTRLQEYETQLAAHEKRFAALVVQASEGPPEEAVHRIKDELALMIGNVDKLQMSGIDSVLVSDLKTGKQEAKEHRKKLNMRAETLSERAKELHGAIVKHLEEKKSCKV